MSLYISLFLRGTNNRPVGKVPYSLYVDHGCFGTIKAQMMRLYHDKRHTSKYKKDLEDLKVSIPEWETSGYSTPSEFDNHIGFDFDDKPSNEEVVPGVKYHSALTYDLPLEHWLIRLYIPHDYHNKGSRFSIGKGIDEGIVPTVELTHLLRHTLRTIPEFSYLIGPSNHDQSIDLIVDPDNLRAMFCLFWIIRTICGYPYHHITPTVITTVAALSSIKPGLALYYLLWMQSCNQFNGTFRYVVGGSDGVVPNGTGIGSQLVQLNNAVNNSLGKWTQWGADCLSAFYSGSPPLSTILKFVTSGKIPPEIGVVDTDNDNFSRRNTDPGYIDTSGRGIKNSLCASNALEGKVRRPKLVEPEPVTREWVLNPEQVIPALQELNVDWQINDPGIRTQLDNIVLEMTGRRIEYFTKKPLQLPKKQMDLAI